MYWSSRRRRYLKFGTQQVLLCIDADNEPQNKQQREKYADSGAESQAPSITVPRLRRVLLN
jgi:hypothetical protein